MIGSIEIFVGLVIMLVLMFLGLHVATVMFIVGILGAAAYIGMPAINAVGEQLWGASDDYLLLSIPLYILLGEILVRGGATDKMYRSLSDWLNRLPGGLLHTNSVRRRCFRRSRARRSRQRPRSPLSPCRLPPPQIRSAPGARLHCRRRQPRKSRFRQASPSSFTVR